MSEAAIQRPDRTRGLPALARELTGLLAGGLLGSITWMIVAHEGEKRFDSEVSFPEALGEVRGAELTDAPRLGLWTALVVGTLIAGVLLPLLFRTIPGPWYLRSLPLAAVVFLLWGLWFSPRVGEETTFPGGVFASEASGGTLLAFALASIGYAAVAGRVYSVTRALDFWRDKDNDLRAQGADVLRDLGLGPDGKPPEPDPASREASLELAEQGTDEPGKAPGA
jgi:hypothetical protein